jgi:hypothetical protein
MIAAFTTTYPANDRVVPASESQVASHNPVWGRNGVELYPTLFYQY